MNVFAMKVTNLTQTTPHVLVSECIITEDCYSTFASTSDMDSIYSINIRLWSNKVNVQKPYIMHVIDCGDSIANCIFSYIPYVDPRACKLVLE